LYVHFLDFEKKLDSVYRDSLWLIMQSYGTSSKMISRVKAHYNDLECTVVMKRTQQNGLRSGKERY